MKAWNGFIILVVIAGIFFLGILTAVVQLNDKPNWACDAEDEVVIIDNTCWHIDQLHGVHHHQDTP